MANKIIIEMSGGVVQQVFSTDENIKVEILDHDDLSPDASPDDKERAKQLQIEMEKMVIV